MILLLLACAGCGDQSHAPGDTTDTTTAGCPTGELLDGDTCVPEACGVGTWGNLPVDDNTVHVAEGGTGDGTEADPLGSIQDGVDLAGERDGAVVAVAAGTYIDTISMGDDHRGVTLAGRCRELVTIDGSEGEEVPAIEVVGVRWRPEVQIEGVTVTGGTAGGIFVEQAAVTVAAADLRENTVFGVGVVAGELALDLVGVYATLPERRGGSGRGVDVEYGGTLTATGCTVQGNTAVGIFAMDTGTTVDLVDTLVLDTAPSADGSDGRGISIESGAELTTSGCTIQRNTSLGVYVSGSGTQATLLDTSVLDTAPGPDGSPGWGIQAKNGASLTVTGCTVQRNTSAGVVASDPDTTADLFDTSVLDTAPSPDGSGGWGIAASDGAALTATGCTVQGNNEVGVGAGNAGTTLDLLDTVVRDTAPSPDGSGGWGLDVEDAAALTATGCTIEGNTESGVYASGYGATVNLTDTSVLDTAPRPDGAGGMGIEVHAGAALTATNAVVQRSSSVGVFVGDLDSTAALIDTELLDTVANATGAYGRGINVQTGGALTCTRCTVRGNADTGVFADGSGTIVDLTDTSVSDTAPSPDGSSGRGIGVQTGATLSATGCTITGNTDIGIFAGGIGATVDLVDTSVLDTSPSPDGTGGRGISVQNGASLSAFGCTIDESTEFGVGASGVGAVVDLVDTAVINTRRGRFTGFAIGLIAGLDAHFTATGGEVSGTDGPAAYAVYGAALELRSSSLSSNTFAGVLALDATTILDTVTITDTLPDAEWGGGFGLYASDPFGPPSLTLTNSTIGPHPYAAVWLDGDGTYVIEDNDLSGNAPYDLRGIPVHGNAVFAERGVTAWNGSSGLLLAGNHFHDATDVAVLLDGATAELVGNTWADNGTEVWQQHCEDTTQLVSPDPDWVVCPEGNVLTDFALQFTSLYLPDVEPL